MKRIFSCILFLIVCLQNLVLDAQILKPVKWKFSTSKLSDQEYNLILEASIDKNWHLYGQKNYGEEGPIPTTFKFENNKNLELVGKIIEPTNKIKKVEPVFGDMELEYFEHKAIFKQKVKIKNPKEKASINGELEFMTCDDKQCLPPETVEYSFDIDPLSSKQTNNTDSVKNSPVKPVQKIDSSVVLNTNVDSNKVALDSNLSQLKQKYPNCGEADNNENNKKETSIWWTFLLGIGGGLLALIMPCTFPMIPMTVSFFLKRNKERNKAITEAIIYGLSIIFIYTIPTAIITKFMGADALNALSSSAFFNLLFFVIFVVFAFSMFGYYEIQAPNWLVNKSDQMGDKGGWLGIFFMAFTLALVSFSCTGPVVGSSLVAAAQQGSWLNLVMVMLGFSTAMAVPFALFAMFPQMLKNLPKSGGWMTTVKVVFGLIELIFAWKFLSNVDLAYHWGIIKLEVFLVLWAILALITGLYLLNIINPFPHDEKTEKVGWARKILALVFFAFAGYCAYGTTGANLSLISGFPPPSYYTLRKQKHQCPLNLSCYKTLEEGIAEAKKSNKPIMIDFTGYSCVNCRRMEDNVWVKPEIFDIINKDYVLVSLYVDDKKEMPIEQHYVDTVTQKTIKTFGKKWSQVQRDLIQTNSQPYYVLVDSDLKFLNAPTAYQPDVAKYKSFLECGLQHFKK